MADRSFSFYQLCYASQYVIDSSPLYFLAISLYAQLPHTHQRKRPDLVVKTYTLHLLCCISSHDTHLLQSLLLSSIRINNRIFFSFSTTSLSVILFLAFVSNSLAVKRLRAHITSLSSFFYCDFPCPPVFAHLIKVLWDW